MFSEDREYRLSYTKERPLSPWLQDPFFSPFPVGALYSNLRSMCSGLHKIVINKLTVAEFETSRPVPELIHIISYAM
jgi:hypothetical protein